MSPKCLFPCAAAAIICASSGLAQSNRITQTVDNSRRTVLAGHLHPKALAANDQGRVAPSLPMSYVALTLAPTPGQQADLDKLLAAQQTQGSPSYRQWLTPEQYAQRFGVSDADIGKITQWLEGQGLKVLSVARARNSIAVSGMAAQVEAAFQTEIHTYVVDGETHYANTSEPSVPAAFGSVVKGIRGLNDFRMKPRAKPRNTAGRGAHYLAPDDQATIYGISSLYTAGINGTGQKIAIAGQTEVNLSDITTFRSTYNLPVNNPQTVLVPGSQNPGIQSKSGDLAESDLDLEWSGAVARNATIIFVYSTDVMTSVQYAIDQNLAAVVSISYGSCEQETPTSEVSAFEQWAQQANAQGITWFAASGDNGGADCGDSQNPGLAVDLPGSVPEVTSVGGTEFVEGTGVYWSSTNNANGASVLSYIPETTWNDSVSDGTPAASGGGASILFSKPSWQTGTGVPGDNARHVPDVSLSASADHDGYLVYTGGSLQVYGGTSVTAPSFAGLTALLNQQLGSGGVGNINPNLYSLAQAGWASGMFHDITTGNNIVTVACSKRAPNCGATPVGYSAGVGYDQATGLGSVDAYRLVMGWTGNILPSSPANVVTLLSNLSTVTANEVVYLTATATAANGTTPAGSVSFSIDGTSLGTAVLTGSAGSATATLTLTGSQLPLGTGSITATFNGTNSTPVTVSVTSGSGSNGTPAVGGVANAASFKSSVAPGSILSVFGSQLSPVTASASAVPLPISISGVAVLVNGIAAPLYYVSASQLNVQIPYETTTHGPVTLSVNNNGQVATQSFQVTPAAPGIFTDATGALVPTPTGAPGQEIAFYITGAGAVSPAVSTGAAPAASTTLANLPVPVQTTTVTIGGATATIDFIAIPSGLVGVTQVNVQVPSGIASGAQAVVVTVGGVASAPATITIN
jgi:uncharacterized protein (TIGR03437 family)